MPIRHFRSIVRVLSILVCIAAAWHIEAQDSWQLPSANGNADSQITHAQRQNRWFYTGRIVAGKNAAQLRKRAYDRKLKIRSHHAAALAASNTTEFTTQSSISWTPLGPVPLASDASGNGTQDYRQVAGRATAVVIDPADPTGNTVYVGGAQAGVWKSTNAANSDASSVTWTALTDTQATLSIGALAVQPGNNNPANSVILAATGEADNASDSYFGLGILRSADGGNSWNPLIETANNHALSFAGLGGARMAFSTATGQTNTVVAAMAVSSEALVSGAASANTMPGLYTSANAGQTWTYDTISDPGGAIDAQSATSVVYNSGAGLFFAAIRYHGFYSSPDGLTWTRLPNQPGGALLSTSACPPQSASNAQTCPMFRAEITAVQNRNEMYIWFIYYAASQLTDGGIWQSLNGGASWTEISDSGISNCGDPIGCGVEQGFYNLELLAAPNGATTDLYAGSINLYKCSINSQNPTCAASPFVNLTHSYGCDPISAPAHVHPGQHALAYAIPTSGSVSGLTLMYFANDGGLYRALDGVSGLSGGSCSGTNAFDDLNQNLGSMTQFVGFSQHPSDANTLLGGAQDNGSPATGQATSLPANLAWGNVLGGDGAYTAIDPNAAWDFYASNPDIPPGGLAIQFCSNGVNCNDRSFSPIITSDDLGSDDGAYDFPYILDSQSPSTLLVGTCRLWRGPRSGGSFTVLSPNFDTLASGICSGSEVNQVRAIAVGGPADINGSTVIYATTNGYGPLDGPQVSPSGGHVWVTTNATAGLPSFVDTTNNGPQGSINPNQFPISSVAIDNADPSGQTAYITIMGFTAPPGSTTAPGHVWKTTTAGRSWTDFSGNLPDSPANALLIDSSSRLVYVGTDVGVFMSSTVGSASWTEVGPTSGNTGFLPNAPVTALALFNSGGYKLLRASTYGRGIWQYNLVTTPDYQLAISNSLLMVFSGQTGVFNGTATAVNGYTSSVTLSCAGSDAPHTCTFPPDNTTTTVITPSSNGTPFHVTVGGIVDGYNFRIQGVGADPDQTVQSVPVVFKVVAFALTSPSSSSVSVQQGSTSAGVDFQVTAEGPFDQAVNLSCPDMIADATCNFSPSTVNPTSTNSAKVSLTVTALPNAPVGSYPITIQATTVGTSPVTTPPPPPSFTLTITAASSSSKDYKISGNPSISAVPGGHSVARLALTSLNQYSGKINATCNAGALAAATCTLSPVNPISLSAGGTTNFSASINVPNDATPGSYSININTQDTTGMPSHSYAITLTVMPDFVVTSSTTSQTVNPGQTTGPYNLMVRPVGATFTSPVTLSCSGLPAGAQCVFNPSGPVTPGDRGVDVVMTISTSSSTPALNHRALALIWLLSSGLMFSVIVLGSAKEASERRKMASMLGSLVLLPLAFVLLSCGGASSGGGGGNCASAPTVPSNLSASNTTGTSTTLNWSASSATVGCSVAYTVYEGINGASPTPLADTTTNTNYVISGLTAQTHYAFAVAAADAFGTSALSTPITVTTTGAVYTVTVTGTSPGMPSDPGQSTQVTLVVN